VQEALSIVSRIIAENEHRDGAFQSLLSFLRQTFPHYNWIGIYLIENGKLVLSAWDGEKPTEHKEIDIGQGICGLAAREKKTIIVDDVGSHPEYLACFAETKSEIVVPLMKGDACVGEIDIDSNTPSAFNEKDKEFLEMVASLLVDAYF